MEGTQIEKLQQQYEQMVRLRNDNSLLTGFSFNTVAGTVSIDNKHKATLMLDYYIKELKDEIIHEKNEAYSAFEK